MLAVTMLLVVAGFVLVYVGVRGLNLRTEILRVFGGG